MATLAEGAQTRPNIRIEIKNNITEMEEMDFEDSALDENEEGEIVDDDEDIAMNYVEMPKNIVHELEPRSKDIFTTGIDIFDKETQEKLEERAKRFALKPEEIHRFTDADLEELYESLGITEDNERITRFDTVYMYGTAGLTTEDILEYFAKYAPTHIEWVDRDSCNVRWFENITAARAMFYTSKAVNGMPVREPVNTFAKEFLDDYEEPEKNSGQSILLKNQNVDLRLEDILPSKTNLKNAVDISEITIPIPPGYWRLGQKHSKIRCLLLRYALKTDKKPYEIKDLTKYYKKLGNLRSNHENGDEDSRGLFERNRDFKNSKNPWGSLAKNWNKDKKFCEPDPNVPTTVFETKNPRLLVRLGKKRIINEEVEEDSEASDKKSRPMPRMRMYADEEEERQKRRRALLKLKKTEELTKENVSHTKDLRSMIRHPVEIVDLIEHDASDLGARLRNRTQRMVFTVQRDLEENSEIGRGDARKVLQARRRRSSGNQEHPRLLDRNKSPSRRDGSYERHTGRRSPYSSRRLTHHRRSRERSIHRGRMRSDLIEIQKPRSKVAVVIKKPKQPAVASTIWSKVKKSQSESESSSEASEEESSESEEGSSSSEESETESESGSSEESISDSDGRHKSRVQRPGFGGAEGRSNRLNETPLKITMKNDHYRRK